MTAARVTGAIGVSPGAVVDPAATAHVSLIDTSLADAPSVTVATQTIANAGARLARGEPLAFDLDAPTVDPHASYSVRVHIGADADRLLPGDLVTTQSYPVLTFGHPSRVDVIAKKVE